MDDLPENAWCRCAGIGPPAVEKVWLERRPKLRAMMVVALLEAGRPQSLDEIVMRLQRAGISCRSGDLHVSLVKAWHGLAPIDRIHDGRFTLDTASIEFEIMLFDLGLRTRSAVKAREPILPPPPPDDVPLTPEEVDAAVKACSTLSPTRRAAAILEIAGRPLSLGEIETELSRITGRSSHLDRRSHSWRLCPYLVSEAPGVIQLRATAPEMVAVRREIRAKGRAELERRAVEARNAASSGRWQREWKEREAREAAEAACWRRAVVRTYPETGMVVAAALLDVQDRSIRTWIGDDASGFAKEVAGYRLIAGLHVRHLLRDLGLDEHRFHLVDLSSGPKSRKLNRAGRTLKVTPSMLISATTGISTPLAEPGRIRSYLVSGETAKLRRRLESDVKALYAYYNSGVLHRSVRLRWGFIDEQHGVNWAVPGDPNLHRLLRAAAHCGKAVEVVLGSAPAWSSPWSRAIRGTVRSFDGWYAVVEADGVDRHISSDWIQALREADPSESR